MVYFGENPQAKKQKHVHFWVKIEGIEGKEWCQCGKMREIKDFPTIDNIPNPWTDKKKEEE